MFKFYRSVMMAGVVTLGLAACGDDVTITDPPEPPAPGVTSVTVSPSNASVGIGQSVVFAASVIADNGVSTVVTWSSSDQTIATVDATGRVTGVAAGTTTIIATSSADNGKTGVGSITVSGAPAVVPAQVSIQSITTGLLNTPVALNNVFGQIEINLNFNPGNQRVDSLKVFIGGKSAAKQTFVTNPAPGPISMSVNTANFVKNAAAGTTTVDFFNGPSTVTAVAYVSGGANVATQGTQIVLNNTSGWAADVTKPTTLAVGVPLSSAVGQTFWGGPTAAGRTLVTLYPVIYESGRSINTVTFGMGGCPNLVVDATLPFSQSFGYTAAGATVSCTGYEWMGGNRDNVFVVSSIDNASNAFPNGGLIANTIVFGATPDSLRLDYAGPSTVSAPQILGSEGFNWVNDAYSIRPTTPVVADFGVGATVSATSYTIAVGTSAGVSTVYGTTYTNVAALAETNTNCALPTAGCDGYAARAVGLDLLGNPTNSAVSATFGVDRTAPQIRYSTTTTLPSIYTAGGTTALLDSTTYQAYVGLYGVDAGAAATGDIVDYLAAAAGTNDSVRTESIDNRSGLSRSIITSRRFAQGGAAGTTGNTGCQSVAVNNFGAALLDGWRPAPQVHVTCGSSTAGYYTTSQQTVDRAGNLSTVYKRTLALDPAQPQVTGVSPNANYVGNTAATFTIGTQDDLEVIDARLRLNYANVSTGDNVTPAAGLVWNYGFSAPFATRFDASIINPFLGSLALDMFTVSIQEVSATNVAPPYIGDPINAGGVVKPDAVGVAVRDVNGSFHANFASGALTGVSAEFVSPILSATVPAVGTYSVTYNATTNCPAGGVVGGPCVIGGVNFRGYATTATTRTFRATEALSVTLPIFTRVDLFGLNAAGQWVFIQRITVPAVVPTNGTIAAGAGTITGSDNGFERYWDYQFTAIPSGFLAYRALGVNAAGHGLFSSNN